jgi:hypothetical protein
MPVPTPVDLTGYLSTLAGEVGYRIEPDQLDPACGHHPELVLAWVAAGARHAGLTYTRGLLPGGFEVAHEQVNSPDHTCQVAAEALLCQLYGHDELLAAALAQARRSYTGTLARLTGTGLTVQNTR